MECSGRKTVAPHWLSFRRPCAEAKLNVPKVCLEQPEMRVGKRRK
jgi:hypothetical protein